MTKQKSLSIIAFVGLPGSGKTTAAAHLATLGAPHITSVDTEEIIQEITHIADAGQRLIALDDLAGQPLIQLMVDEIEESTRRLTAALPVKPQIAFRTRSVEAVRSLVATGAGLAILPSLVYRPWSLEGDRIEIRDVSGDLPSVQVGLAWRKGAPLTAPASNFIRSAQSTTAVRPS